MPLSAEQVAELRELVTPAAWNYYQTLDASLQLNLDVRLRMVGGDLNKLAAAVLRVACQQAGRTAVGSGGKEKIKVGPIELETYDTTYAAAGADAEAWCKLADQLDSVSLGSGVPGPRLVGWNDDW